MSMQDPLADLLTRIRNGLAARHRNVSMPSSRLKAAVCGVLRDEGYIKDFSVDEGVRPTLTVSLRYHNGAPAIEELKRVSRPGLRVYRGCRDIPRVRGGLGVAVVSTPRGVITDRAARQSGVGGEVLCTVF
ncbi:MAG: 30S ribosomal protein S8 [Gammaproteobacteria bacterium]|nr:30S ribosomal protein S8 [Gammaproteobacteria bacterium]MYE80901.1 30S ribosomal protein S8 [Gammaproteobacteria bacterium]